jgi:hypothetical protein
VNKYGLEKENRINNKKSIKPERMNKNFKKSWNKI